MRFERSDFLFLLLFLAAAFLLLKGLGHSLYWQDEAQTGLMAERVLRYGYPRVWDGRNLITGMNGRDFNGSYVLTWDGWLPYYIAAASFRIFGISTAAGRLPFALVALFTLPLLYRFVSRLTKDKTAAFWSAAFLILSMAFLLHARQCRYYPLLPFGMLLVYDGLLDLPRWRGRGLVALGLTILYHANLLGFGLALISMMLLPFFFEVEKEKLKALGVALVMAFATTFPMFLYTRLWEKSAGFEDSIYKSTYAVQFFVGLLLWNKFFLPFPLFGAAFALRNRFLNALGKKILSFTALLVALALFLIPIKFYSGNRYFLSLLPASCLALAVFHVGAWRRSKAVGTVLFAVLLATHAWYYLPAKAALAAAKAALPHLSETGRQNYWKAYSVFRQADDEEGPSNLDTPFDRLYEPSFSDRLWKTDYLSLFHEMFHPFHDGLEEIDDFVKSHGKPGERIYLPVGQYPLLFHDPDTLLAYTISAPPALALSEPLDPSQWDRGRIDWFVPRYYKQPLGPHITEEEFVANARARGWTLEKYVMKTSPVLWEGNWPNWYRMYRIKQGEFPVLPMEPTVLYHVVREPSSTGSADAAH